MKKLLFLTLGVCSSIFFVSGNLAAQNTAPAASLNGKKLRVVTRVVEPFVMQDGNGDLSGYSIELWEGVASKAHLDYEYQVVKTVPEMVQALQENKADVGVAALTINAEREKIIGFTHPFYESGLKVAVPATGSSNYVAIMKNFLSLDFLLILLTVLALLVLASVLIWVLERKHNAESFPEPAREGISEAFWYCLNVIIAGGCENKSPVSFAGRVVATVWMIASLILVVAFTATVTSKLTTDALTGDIKSPQDLASGNRKVATLKGTAAERYLINKLSITPDTNYSTLKDALKALSQKKVDAVVYDAPILMYMTKDMGGKVQVLPFMFDEGAYGFGLSEKTPNDLRKALNFSLLSLKESGKMKELDKKYFAPETAE